MSWLRKFDTQKLVTAIVFLAIFAMAARVSMDTDSWWHLRAGQWILENRQIPGTDPFSYTRFGAPWQYPGWLVEIPMIAIYNLAGPGGLNVWTAVLVTLAFVFVWRTTRGGVFIRAFVIVLAATTSGVYWAARPYLVTFVLAAVFLSILEDYRVREPSRGYRQLYWLPALMIIWANSHGGFIIGLIILGVYLLSAINLRINDRRLSAGINWADFRPLVGIFFLCIIGISINPHGPVMLLYPFKTVGISSLKDYIQEWQSPNFHAIEVQPFAWLLLLTLAAVGISRRRILFTDLALVTGFGYLGLLAGRNIALFALVAPMVIIRHAAPITAAISRRLGFRPISLGMVPSAMATFNLVIATVLLLVVLLKIAIVVPQEANETAFARGLPVGAVKFIEEKQPPGRLFNSYNWGGYLLWTLPEYPVFIDGRTDLYDDELVSDWVKAVQAQPGWQEVLDRWEVRLVLLEPDRPIVSKLEIEGWQLLYKDEQAVLYGR